jgi:hypothetical protein
VRGQHTRGISDAFAPELKAGKTTRDGAVDEALRPFAVGFSRRRPDRRHDMGGTEQPPAEPYDVGDRVRVRIDGSDADSPFDGAVCRVVHVFTDEPDDGVEPERRTDRETDRASYRLESVERGETLPVVVRHRDLRPVAERD